MEKRLGKGLSALISEDISSARGKVEQVRISEVSPNPFQPRKRFNENALGELINSIREKGVIQPILVRQKESGYELVAGERRLRAAQALGVEEIPAIIRTDIDDANSLEISLIENIQREELNPVEEARAYQELINKFAYTLEKVGQMMGKDKSTISNSLRILALGDKILGLIEDGKLSQGHAKTVLSIESTHRREYVADMIVKKGMSVREAEHYIRRTEEPKKRPSRLKDPNVLSVEEQLKHKYGTKVTIFQGKKRGKIEIQYFSQEDLNRIIGMLI
ncbi:MAG: ParB/RepB/Spo0J family partition protein [Candidatus Omnitrophica bacterium]|nr:ParB/RepB/Spo0J family partition protein [Candidatus Omnitrophota bacterium]MDD5488714.1 ParB/RepB/Spo0J family partition protein [Candidatus Omnitrophota bacterium]